jgi:hypothetical protein
LFCPTDLHRTARTRTTLNHKPIETLADQDECNSDEPCRTELNQSHPAENRKEVHCRASPWEACQQGKWSPRAGLTLRLSWCRRCQGPTNVVLVRPRQSHLVRLCGPDRTSLFPTFGASRVVALPRVFAI